MLRYLPLLLFALLACVFAWRLSFDGKTPASYRDPMLGEPLPAIVLPLLQSDDAEGFNLAALRGKAFLLNVFASWCAACKQEHPVLKTFAEQENLPVYGIAWKDKPEHTQRWLENMGHIYEAVGMDETGKAAIALGLTGVPETYLIAPDGTIAALYRGALSESAMQNRFLPALKQLEKR